MDYQLVIVTNVSDQRLELLYKNVRLSSRLQAFQKRSAERPQRVSIVSMV